MELEIHGLEALGVEQNEPVPGIKQPARIEGRIEDGREIEGRGESDIDWKGKSEVGHDEVEDRGPWVYREPKREGNMNHNGGSPRRVLGFG